MLDALPWILCTCAVLAVLVMVCLEGAKRRPAGDGPRLRRDRTKAAQTRRELQRATRANLERIAGALESDDPEGRIADELNRAEELDR